MLGIFFLGHPNISRILTDYGFVGYPLRKDFPLSGFSEVRYSENKGNTINKTIELNQEYRIFDYSTPWNN